MDGRLLQNIGNNAIASACISKVVDENEKLKVHQAQAVTSMQQMFSSFLNEMKEAICEHN